MTEFRKWLNGHWKALSLIVVAALALATGTYAYWKTSPSSASSQLTSTFTRYPLELRTELNKTEFRLGEGVTINFSLKNISNRTITLHYPSWRPNTNDFTFNITDQDGRIIFSFAKNYAALYVTRTYTLEPSAEKKGTFTWNQISDVLVEKAPHVFENEQVSSGVYKLIGGSGYLREITYTDNNQATILDTFEALRTSPLTITVD